MSITLMVETTFTQVTCCNCGIAFAMPAEIDTRRQRTHEDFYCPNGHAQHYIEESEAEKLRRQLTEAMSRENKLFEENHKLKKRITNGVCPCCKRSFQDLKRHIKAIHPEFK